MKSTGVDVFRENDGSCTGASVLHLTSNFPSSRRFLDNSGKEMRQIANRTCWNCEDTQCFVTARAQSLGHSLILSGIDLPKSGWIFQLSYMKSTLRRIPQEILPFNTSNSLSTVLRFMTFRYCLLMLLDQREPRMTCKLHVALCMLGFCFFVMY